MAGKGAIVYYSWVGNTRAVAEELKARTGYDLIAIREKKARDKKNIGKAAFGAFFGLKSAIEPMDFSLTGYDRVLFGAQIWAGRTPPAVNAYLARANLSGKKVWLFVTKADEKVPAEFIAKLKARIEKKGGEVADSISFTTKMDSVISPEAFGGALGAWLEKNGLA